MHSRILFPSFTSVRHLSIPTTVQQILLLVILPSVSAIYAQSKQILCFWFMCRLSPELSTFQSILVQRWSQQAARNLGFKPELKYVSGNWNWQDWFVLIFSSTWPNRVEWRSREARRGFIPRVEGWVQQWALLIAHQANFTFKFRCHFWIKYQLRRSSVTWNALMFNYLFLIALSV